jgi:hypothetical protein
MRKPLLLLLMLVMIHCCFGQKKLPKFGHYTDEEMAFKDASFDPGADIVCLFEECEVQFNLNGSRPLLETFVRKRFKVLKTAGVESANIKLSYYSKDGFENISGVEGYVYNTGQDGKVVTAKMKNNETYRKRIDDSYSELSFALPEVKVGSVYEYKYRVYRQTIGGIAPWKFQHAYPTLYSCCHLLIPEYFDFTYSTVRRQPMEVKADGSVNGSFYSMSDIPGIHDEPYMAGTNDFIQRVDFHLTRINPPGEMPIVVGTTWADISKQLQENTYFGQQLNRNIKGTDSLKTALAACKTKQDKLIAIYQFVQQYMAWNGDNEIFSSDAGIKDAWDKKQGNSADINMILVDLLKDNDIQAYPILVSTRDNGSVQKGYPNLMQFNATMAVARLDSTVYVMNAADKYNPYDLVPYDVQYTYGFIVDKKNSGWLTIYDDRKKEKSFVTVSLNLGKDGKLAGIGRAAYSDYARNLRLNDYRKKQLKDRLTMKGDINLNIDSLQVQNENLWQKPLDVQITCTGKAKTSGKYTLIPYDLFMGLEDNPFTADKRQTNINFGYLQDLQVTGYINLPEGYTVESLPKSMKMQMSDSSILFKRIFQQASPTQLAFQLRIQHLRPEYSTVEYDDLKAYYKKMYELLDERIVLKKM